MWFFSHPVRRKPNGAACCWRPKSSLEAWAKKRSKILCTQAFHMVQWCPMMSNAPCWSAEVWNLGFSRSAGLQEPIFVSKSRFSRCDFTKDPLRNLHFFLVLMKINIFRFEDFCLTVLSLFILLRGSHLSPFRMTNFSNSGRCDGALTHNLQPRSVKWWARIPVINGLFIPVQVDNMTPLSICRFWSSFTSIVTWSSLSQVGMTTKRGVLRTHLMKHLVFWGSLKSLDNGGKGILHAIRWKL